MSAAFAAIAHRDRQPDRKGRRNNVITTPSLYPPALLAAVRCFSKANLRNARTSVAGKRHVFLSSIVATFIAKGPNSQGGC
jgi:hypothetical protein